MLRVIAGAAAAAFCLSCEHTGETTHVYSTMSAAPMEMNTRGTWKWLLAVTALSVGFTLQAGQGGNPPCDTEQFKRVQRDAARGLANAQTALAGNYAEGRCVTQDYAQAALWYRRAAEQGNADAQYELAMYLMEGKEVTLDEASAAKWLARAAAQNHPEAQYALGVLYVQGRGLPKDIVQGYVWIRVSSPTPDQHVQDVLAEVAKSMSRSDIDRAEAVAASWISAHPNKHSRDTPKK
jgi:hypothetical protein